MGFWDYLLDDEAEQPPTLRDMVVYQSNMLKNLVIKISQLEEEIKSQRDKIQELESVVEFLVSD